MRYWVTHRGGRKKRLKTSRHVNRMQTFDLIRRNRMSTKIFHLMLLVILAMSSCNLKTAQKPGCEEYKTIKRLETQLKESRDPYLHINGVSGLLNIAPPFDGSGVDSVLRSLSNGINGMPSTRDALIEMLKQAGYQRSAKYYDQAEGWSKPSNWKNPCK